MLYLSLIHISGIPSVVYGLIGMMVLVPAVMELFHLRCV